MASLRSIFLLACVAGVVSCASAPLVVTPSPASPPACPLEGCAGGSVGPPQSAGPMGGCIGAGSSPCAGTGAPECTQRALTAWSEAQDDRAVACVARMLDEACMLGDAHACAFVGRLEIDGRGVVRDVERGMASLVSACDGGVAIACVMGVRWLSEPVHARDLPEASDLRGRFEAEHACLSGEPESCFQVGLLFYLGRHGFPRDAARAISAYRRGCDLGAALACNNLGDAFEYGDGIERDLVASAAMFDKACRLGEAMGCANLGHLFERGEGVLLDPARARFLYREACTSGDVYGCLHGEMLTSQGAGSTRDPQRALSHWRRACDNRDARACAFVGVIFEDGPDGLARDAEQSMKAMNRACSLGEERACEWVKAHPGQ